MSKTPYEIRLELLHMAQSILSEQVRIKNETLLTRVSTLNKNSISMNNKVPEDFEFFPAPSTEDIIKEASLLNKFISDNKE